MFITAFSLTCNRPHLLSRVIRCFERQTYPAKDRYLIVLDDLCQYDNYKGDRWEMISLPRRILSLGEKNNAAIAMMPPETEAIAKMDDDDFYYPHMMAAQAEALMRGEWVQPRHAIDHVDNEWVQIETFNRQFPEKHAYHGGWAYTRELFVRLGGYGADYAGDDGPLQERWLAGGAASVDIVGPPYYRYNRPLPNRISMIGPDRDAYEKCGAGAQFVGKIPEWTDETDWNTPIPEKIIQRGW